MDNFSKKMLAVLSRLNSVNMDDALSKGYQHFYVDNNLVGLIRSDFWSHLKSFSNTFVQVLCGDDTDNKTLKPGVHLHTNLQTYEDRTHAVNKALEQLREKDAINPLRGWRHENYIVCQKYGGTPLLEIERAGSGLFGYIQYGVHVNGFVREANGDISLWIGRRSKTKQTFPDMYDNMCAGGLPAGMGIKECVIKECQEEASIADEILKRLQFTGTVSYFYEDERGVFPECQFVYDLELPHDFKPVNADGEVGSFQKVNVEQLKRLLSGDNATLTCVAICLDFLIRHGLIDPDSDPNCSRYVEQLHAPLQSYYDGK